MSEWPNIDGDALFVVEVGIACVGNWQIRNRPKRGRLTDATWARKEAAWSQEREAAYDRWDALRDARINAVSQIIRHYDAEILGNYHNDTPDAAILPDSFTLRLKIQGRGLRDLILITPTFSKRRSQMTSKRHSIDAEMSGNLQRESRFGRLQTWHRQSV